MISLYSLQLTPPRILTRIQQLDINVAVETNTESSKGGSMLRPKPLHVSVCQHGREFLAFRVSLLVMMRV